MVDVFVSKKKNKEGKAFGFVRFKEVGYPLELERRLDQIWIGTYKLRANCTRFLRGMEGKAEDVCGMGEHDDGYVPLGGHDSRLSEEKAKKGQFEGGSLPRGGLHAKPNEEKAKKGVSFADAVKGNRKGGVSKRKGGADPDVWQGLKFDVKEDELTWLNNSFVGYVHNPDAVYLLQDRIIDEGVTTFTVTPMGGDMVLIKPREGEDFLEFVKDYEDLVETWFYDIKPWSPGQVATEREAWIRCQGVPLHAWTWQFFEMIVTSFGRLVSLDSHTMNMKRLDVARVLVRTTSWEAINRVTKVSINGNIFSLRLLEEPFHEIVYNHKKTNTEEEELSTSNSNSLDYANFAMGSDVVPSFESDGGMEIDKNDDGHLAREILSHDGGRREVGENEVTNVVGNGAMAFMGRKTKLQSLALTDGIELNLVENSDQLGVGVGEVIPLVVCPRAQMGIPIILTSLRRVGWWKILKVVLAL